MNVYPFIQISGLEWKSLTHQASEPSLCNLAPLALVSVSDLPRVAWIEEAVDHWCVKNAQSSTVLRQSSVSFPCAAYVYAVCCPGRSFHSVHYYPLLITAFGATGAVCPRSGHTSAPSASTLSVRPTSWLPVPFVDVMLFFLIESRYVNGIKQPRVRSWTVEEQEAG